MLITRRRTRKIKNLLSLLRLHTNAKWIIASFNLKLASPNVKNLIMLYFLLQHLVSNYKLPKVTYNRSNNRYGIKMNKNKSLKLVLSNSIQTKLLNYLIFVLPYRFYPFKESLFKYQTDKISLFFVKLPINKKLGKLEEINTGEAINFFFEVLGFYSYIEYIYVLSNYGFADIFSTCMESGLDDDYIINFNNNKKKNVLENEQFNIDF